VKRGSLWAIAGIAILVLVRWLDHGGTTAVDEHLAPPLNVESQYGLAVAVAMDVSTSMSMTVAAPDGRPDTRIAIARRAALDLVNQFASYAQEHPDEPVQLALFEFSTRGNLPECREIIPMSRPDPARAAEAVSQMYPDGGTPIGPAMIAAKLALDATGLSRRHLLVITDGENTFGPKPEDVAVAIRKRPSVEHPAVYFVAFDVNASVFDAVEAAGALVLSATSASELKTTLDTLLRNEILVEK
jgi:Mg-chelatase subunit ChlD